MATRYLLTQTDPVYRHYQAAFEMQGIACEWLPLLRIVHRASLLSYLDLAGYDKVIVLSQHAVNAAASILQQTVMSTAVFAVGAATAAALAALGIQAEYPKNRFDSEHLAALPELSNCSGQNILLLCGLNPRDYLIKTLQSRGAKVTQAAVYFRRRSLQAFCLRRFSSYQLPFDQVVISSQAALDYWHHLAAICPKIRAQKVLVTSQRLYQYACGHDNAGSALYSVKCMPH